jgi:hypothetical protein
MGSFESCISATCTLLHQLSPQCHIALTSREERREEKMRSDRIGRTGGTNITAFGVFMQSQGRTLPKQAPARVSVSSLPPGQLGLSTTITAPSGNGFNTPSGDETQQ